MKNERFIFINSQCNRFRTIFFPITARFLIHDDGGVIDRVKISSFSIDRWIITIDAISSQLAMGQ